MDDDEYFDDLIRDAAMAELADGPMALGELTERLSHNETLGGVDGLELGALEDEDLDEILLDTDDVWMSEDRIVALVGPLLDGAVFSHAVSPSELERGVLDVSPDLSAIDFDADEGLELSGGGTMVCRFNFGDEAGLDGNGSFVGPAGWLAPLHGPALVCLRRTGRAVTLEVRSEVDRGDAEEVALRAAFEQQYVDGVAVEPDRLVLDALVHDPTLFREPVAPVRELLDRIGLESRGAWFGPRGEEWAPPFARFRDHQRARREETWGFGPCCSEAFEVVEGAWADQLLGRSAGDLRPAARALSHGPVAPAFAEYVLEYQPIGNPRLASFSEGVSRLSGKLAAPGLFLQALNAERDGEVLVAEDALRRAVIADPEFGPALGELAWYVADRGDVTRAMSFLRRAFEDAPDPELDYLASLPAPATVQAGRNDPCPCGSGRKFKACCLGKTALPLEARSGWLHHKLARYAVRPAARDRIEWLLEEVGDDVPTEGMGELFPALVDVAIFVGGGIEEFIGERGVLLPDDELRLARSWVGARPKLWEVAARVPGKSITFRDTRSGESTTVTERTASRTVREGQYLLALVLRVGSEQMVFGAPLDIELRLRRSLIELLDSDPDAGQMAQWLGAAFAPPALKNREGEDTVLCRVLLSPRSTPWDRLEASLTRRFGEPHDGRWTETVEIDGDTVVRCFLRRDGDALAVETNSDERLERIVSVLTGEVAADLEVVDEERESVPEARARLGRSASVPALGPDVPPEVAKALETLMRQKEVQWLDEGVPALGGLTPRQAADDPTRREDLVSLLHEFGTREDVPAGGFGFSASRLRGYLGLPDEG